MADLAAAVLLLGDLETREQGVRALRSAGDAAVPSLREGLRHPHWRVRHLSCRLLDDLALSTEVLHELHSLARSDPNKRVRRQAWHALTCEPCKPDDTDLSCVIDPLTAIAEELSDRSLRVRRGGASGLLFAAVAVEADQDAPRVAALVDRVLETETDATIVTRALRAREVLETNRR